ncbi:MAG: GNAT family N-acetyltransferase [Methanobacteriaceae archaeon]|jgi:ribosomal protein S18 acetylase RimI-like enzyme|nr:GNAT family N-acetyltransferase [Candidatus Methanorudis spinitermitis]
MIIKKANFSDLEDILDLQKLAYISEAELYEDSSIEPLKQTLDDIQNEYENGIILKALNNDFKIIGSVRAYKINDTAFIQKLIVHPDFQNKGIGQTLLEAIEKYFIAIDSNIEFKLFTGYKSSKNIYLYKKSGYMEFKLEKISKNLEFIHFKKFNEHK